MEVNKKMEDIILKTHLMTNLNILLVDVDKIVYFMGETKLCCNFLFNKVSKKLKDILELTKSMTILNQNETCKIIDSDKEKYSCQAICRLRDKKEFLIYFKLDNEFSDDELFMIESNTFFIEKFLEE